MANIFDAFEKLITEHGSAAIMRERIALIKDKYETLETENEQLKTENKSLSADLKKEMDAADRLRGLVSRDRERLKEEEEKILIHLAEVTGYTVIGRISQRVGISMLKAEFYLKELENKKYIATPMMVMAGDPGGYKLAHRGREYLIQHDLAQ